VDKKKEIRREVLHMRKHEVERDTIGKHFYQTHTQTNVLATEFSLTILFFFFLSSATEQRTHAETTVEEQSTAAGQPYTLELHAFV